jgi:hypothetical protein
LQRRRIRLRALKFLTLNVCSTLALPRLEKTTLNPRTQSEDALHIARHREGPGHKKRRRHADARKSSTSFDAQRHAARLAATSSNLLRFL